MFAFESKIDGDERNEWRLEVADHMDGSFFGLFSFQIELKSLCQWEVSKNGAVYEKIIHFRQLIDEIIRNDLLWILFLK